MVYLQDNDAQEKLISLWKLKLRTETRFENEVRAAVPPGLLETFCCCCFDWTKIELKAAINFGRMSSVGEHEIIL